MKSRCMSRRGRRCIACIPCFLLIGCQWLSGLTDAHELTATPIVRARDGGLASVSVVMCNVRDPRQALEEAIVALEQNAPLAIGAGGTAKLTVSLCGHVPP